MSRRHHTAAAVALAAAAALLSACNASTDTTPTAATDTTPGTEPSPAATTAAPMKVVAGPLTAKDLTGWKPGSLALGKDWVSGCGQNTGVGALQTSAKTSSLKTPNGVPVLTRVGAYSPGKVTKALQNATDLFTNCPIEDTTGGQRTIAFMDAPAGQQAVGALVSTLDKAGQTTDEVGYWVVKVGDNTVEVWARGRLAATTAQDPMVDFSGAVRDAAVAKALGKPLPKVAVPALATSDTTSGQDGTDPAATDPAAGVDPGTQGPSLTDGSVTDGTITPLPGQPGVGGESGPGAIVGTGEKPGPGPSPKPEKR